MAGIRLKVNGKMHMLEIDPQTPLLWVLRDHLGLTGTKYGCGIAQCGACTVHINGDAARCCVLPVGQLQNAEITTIEGLSENNEHVLQTLWAEMNVPQCGYCQSGMLMAAADLLQHYKSEQKTLSAADVDSRISNICRCGTYPRVRAAILRAAAVEN